MWIVEGQLLVEVLFSSHGEEQWRLEGNLVHMHVPGTWKYTCMKKDCKVPLYFMCICMLTCTGCLNFGNNFE